MKMKKKDKVLPGQISIEEVMQDGMKEAAPPPPQAKAVKTATVVKPVAPTKEPEPVKVAETPKDKKLTEAELEAKKAEWWAKHNEEKKARKKRRAELETSAQEEPDTMETTTVEKPCENTVLPADEDDEEEFDFTSKKKKQKRICRKYGLKQRKLNQATDFAKKLIATKMAAQFEADYVIAIIELMTRGDI